MPPEVSAQIDELMLIAYRRGLLAARDVCLTAAKKETLANETVRADALLKACDAIGELLLEKRSLVSEAIPTGG